jgi:hypothetical protein
VPGASARTWLRNRSSPMSLLAPLLAEGLLTDPQVSLADLGADCHTQLLLKSLLPLVEDLD